GGKPVFWVQHSPDPEDLSLRARQLLDRARLGGVIPGQDSDAFFKELARGLGIGAPTWLREPVGQIRRRADSFSDSDDHDIRAELEDHRVLLGALQSAFEKLVDRHGDSGRMAEARQLRLMGRVGAALDGLRAVATERRSSELWEQIGDLAGELWQKDGH